MVEDDDDEDEKAIPKTASHVRGQKYNDFLQPIIFAENMIWKKQQI